MYPAILGAGAIPSAGMSHWICYHGIRNAVFNLKTFLYRLLIVKLSFISLSSFMQCTVQCVHNTGPAIHVWSKALISAKIVYFGTVF